MIISSNHKDIDNAGQLHQDLPNKQGSRHSFEGRQLLHLGHRSGDISTYCWEKFVTFCKIYAKLYRAWDIVQVIFLHVLQNIIEHGAQCYSLCQRVLFGKEHPLLNFQETKGSLPSYLPCETFNGPFCPHIIYIHWIFLSAHIII